MQFKRLIIIVLCILMPSAAHARHQIDITKGQVSSIAIAINKFATVTPTVEFPHLVDDIAQVIRNDLGGSKAFHSIDPRESADKKRGLKQRPSFSAWRQIGASALLNADIEQRRGKLSVRVVLWDIATETPLFAEVFESPISSWRKVAHKISDKIYERVVGDLSCFDSKIVYVAEEGPAKNKIKKIAIMDYDGANHSFLSNGQNLVLTPRISPQGSKILYLSYANKIAKVHLRDLRTGSDKAIGKFSGISFTPRFSPDGTKALISIAHRGATNIFEINLKNNHLTQLTHETSINTSPSYSPDGRIYFNSDRSGSAQLYSMKHDGSDVQRISFGGGHYTSPVCSPKGDYIAFIKSVRGVGFFIGIMKPDGSQEKLLAKGYMVDNPTWAPNGRSIIFTRSYPFMNNREPSSIFAIDLSGRYERRIETPGSASDADWTH